MRYWIIVLNTVLMPLAPALGQTASPTSCGYEWMSWWGPFHVLVPLLFFGLVIAGVIILVRKLWPNEQRYRNSSRAHELLDERYAKGEIEREEYVRRRQDIRGS